MLWVLFSYRLAEGIIRILLSIYVWKIIPKLTDTKYPPCLSLSVFILSSQKTPTTKSLFECVQSYGPQCIRCVTIPKKQDGGLGITMTTNSEGHVIIGQVSDDLKSQLQTGDR